MMEHVLDEIENRIETIKILLFEWNEYVENGDNAYWFALYLRKKYDVKEKKIEILLGKNEFLE